MTGPLDPHTFYFDLRHKALELGPTPADGGRVFAGLTEDRGAANPVSVVQFGLGALQLRDADWLEPVRDVADWLERELQEDGGVPYLFPMHHTFPLDPPWLSALAQGEAGSFLVRAASALGRPELVDLAVRAVNPLLDPACGLIVDTADGVVLEEYPTAAPSFVLNGWITSLWGLRDVAASSSDAAFSREASLAFDVGVDTVAARLHLYRAALGWSRYDLYPHPIVNVASPAYHKLHIAHLETLHEMAPRPMFPTMIAEWQRGDRNPLARAVALARKAAFRTIRPRSKRVRATGV